jgi:hypothetical protein
MSFSSPVPQPSRSALTVEDADSFPAYFSSPIKPQSSYNRRFVPPRPFTDSNDRRSKAPARVNPLQHAFQVRNGAFGAGPTGHRPLSMSLPSKPF